MLFGKGVLLAIYIFQVGGVIGHLIPRFTHVGSSVGLIGSRGGGGNRRRRLV